MPRPTVPHIFSPVCLNQQAPARPLARWRVVMLYCTASVGLLLCACPSPEQRQTAVHLICTREAQNLLMVHGQVYSDETIKAEMDRRYEACQQYYSNH
jgi:hypothetical protein